MWIMNRVVLILFCLFASVSACMAKGNEDDKDDFLHHNVSLTGGLTVDTWNLALSYRFSPFRYFGIGALAWDSGSSTKVRACPVRPWLGR